MGSTATQRDDQAVVEGLWSEDPLARLLARQVRCSGVRVAKLESVNAELTGEVARLSERVKRLQGKLEGAQREAKRQAAPFSKGTKVTDPKPSGRKAGPGYGRKGAAGAASTGTG